MRRGFFLSLSLGLNPHKHKSAIDRWMSFHSFVLFSLLWQSSTKIIYTINNELDRDKNQASG